jgi:putative ABC transport system permease protein
MDTLLQDLRYSLRMMRRKPIFTAVAILTLALGVGVNVAIFSVVNAVLLRALPFQNPDRLVSISFDDPAVGSRNLAWSVPELEDVRNSGVFEDVSGAVSTSVNLTGAKQPERLELLVTHPSYFSMLGAAPQIGRLFGKQDFALGFAPVVVISDSLWRRSYGADPDVLGRTLHLDNDAYIIIGVLPPGFRHPGTTVARDVDVFLTSGFAADPAPLPLRHNRMLPGALGRLKRGITIAEAQANLTTLAARLRHDYPTDYPEPSHWTIDIHPLQESVVGNIRPMLLVVQGSAFLIVFIVALNLANLLIARAAARQQEMSIRLALGATRARMMRQMITESLTLALIGGLSGIVTAWVTLGSLLHLIPIHIPRLNELNVDWRVLTFALLISLLTGAIFGLAPAIQSARSSLILALREGARGSGYSSRTTRMRDFLIVSQLTFAVVLLIGAGLLLRTLGALLHENPGFNPSHVVSAMVWLPIPNDPKLDPYLGQQRQNNFTSELERRINAIPGVELGAIASGLPTASQPSYGLLNLEDRSSESPEGFRVELIRVSKDYFRVMQAPILSGRAFTDEDTDDKPFVAIVDQSTARRYWGRAEPIGRRFRLGNDPKQPWRTVVGIVRDIKHDGLDVDGVPHIYLSLFQQRGRALSVVLRTSLPATMLEPQIRHQIQSIDSGLPVFNVLSMNDVLDVSLAPRRFSADLVGGFAALSLLLASIGVYGLLAYMVNQRSREIGVRMALGARRSDIVRLVLRKGIVLGSVGIIAGLVVSALTASLMATLLYGVRPHDPAVFLVVPVLLQLVIIWASFLPAWRASRVDPLRALRES